MKKVATTVTVLVAAATLSVSALGNTKGVKAGDKLIKANGDCQIVKISTIGDEFIEQSFSPKMTEQEKLAVKDKGVYAQKGVLGSELFSKDYQLVAKVLYNQTYAQDDPTPNKLMSAKDQKFAAEEKSAGVIKEFKTKNFKVKNLTQVANLAFTLIEDKQEIVKYGALKIDDLGTEIDGELISV